MRTVLQRESRVGFGRGSIADEIDLRPRGIAPVQGTLGTAQDLDAIDVKQLALGLDRQRKSHAVETDADRRGIVRGVVDEPHSPQAKLRLTAAERGLHLKTGDRIL